MFNKLSPKSAAIMQQMFSNQMSYTSLAKETHEDMLAFIKAAKSIQTLNTVMKNFYNEVKTPNVINGNSVKSTLATAFENYPQLAQGIERAYQERRKSLYSENAAVNTIKKRYGASRNAAQPTVSVNFFTQIYQGMQTLFNNMTASFRSFFTANSTQTRANTQAVAPSPAIKPVIKAQKEVKSAQTPTPEVDKPRITSFATWLDFKAPRTQQDNIKSQGAGPIAMRMKSHPAQTANQGIKKIKAARKKIKIDAQKSTAGQPRRLSMAFFSTFTAGEPMKKLTREPSKSFNC